jgi:hypothetical protein
MRGMMPRRRFFQAEHALDDQQVAGRRAAHAHAYTAVVRLALMWVVRGVVDGVGQACLRVAGCGGQGEVRVATEFAQQDQFVVDTAPAAVGTRVVQAPVAVDEGEAQLPGHRVAR